MTTSGEPKNEFARLESIQFVEEDGTVVVLSPIALIMGLLAVLTPPQMARVLVSARRIQRQADDKARSDAGAVPTLRIQASRVVPGQIIVPPGVKGA